MRPSQATKHKKPALDDPEREGHRSGAGDSSHSSANNSEDEEGNVQGDPAHGGGQTGTPHGGSRGPYLPSSKMPSDKLEHGSVIVAQPRQRLPNGAGAGAIRTDQNDDGEQQVSLMTESKPGTLEDDDKPNMDATVSQSMTIPKSLCNGENSPK